MTPLGRAESTLGRLGLLLLSALVSEEGGAGAAHRVGKLGRASLGQDKLVNEVERGIWNRVPGLYGPERWDPGSCFES